MCGRGAPICGGGGPAICGAPIGCAIILDGGCPGGGARMIGTPPTFGGKPLPLGCTTLCAAWGGRATIGLRLGTAPGGGAPVETGIICG